MGVDFYTCDNCSRNYPDCSYTATWCSCGGHFCSPDCADREGANDEDDGGTCVLCRVEVIKAEDMLSFLLKHFKITYDEAKELYRNGK